MLHRVLQFKTMHLLNSRKCPRLDLMVHQQHSPQEALPHLIRLGSNEAQSFTGSMMIRHDLAMHDGSDALVPGTPVHRDGSVLFQPQV